MWGIRVLSASVERVCERCAGEDEDLALVRRAPPAGDVAEGGDAVDAGAAGAAAELWCFTCRSEHSHVEVDEAS